MDFIGAIKSGFRNYANFRGVATRSEYWFWILFLVASFIVLSILESALWPSSYMAGPMGGYSDGYGMMSGTSGYSPLSDIFGLGILLPTLAMTARRFHDAGFSGKWLWLQAGSLLLLIVGVVGLGVGMASVFYGSGYGINGWDVLAAMMMALAPALMFGLAYSIFQLVITLRPSKSAEAGNKYAVVSDAAPVAPVSPEVNTEPAPEAAGESTVAAAPKAPAKPKAAPKKAAPKAEEAVVEPAAKAPAKPKAAPKKAAASED